MVIGPFAKDSERFQFLFIAMKYVKTLAGVICLPAFLDTYLPRRNVQERDSGPMRGAIPTKFHNP